MALVLKLVTGAWLVYALAALLLAVAVTRARPVTLGNGALAALLVQQAGGTVAAVVLFSTEGGAIPQSAFHLGAFFWLLWGPIVFLAGPALLESSPRARVAWIVGGLGAAPGLFAGGAWLFWPDFVFTQGGWALTPAATFILLLAFLGLASSVVFLAWEAYATPMPLRRGRFAILAAALGGEGAYHASQNAGKIFGSADFHGGILGSSMEEAIAVAPSIVFGLVLAAALWVSFLDKDADRRKWARVVAGVLAVAVATGVFAAPLMSGQEFDHPSGIFHAVWDLGFLCLLFFAGMRYQLFTLERRAQQGVAVLSALAVGVIVFFFTEQAAEDYLQSRFAGILPKPNLVAAAVVMGVSMPLHKLGVAIGRKVFPRVREGRDYERERAEEIYRAAVEGALLDGYASPQEARTLVRLRETLRIPEADARRIESTLVRVVEQSAAPA